MAFDSIWRAFLGAFFLLAPVGLALGQDPAAELDAYVQRTMPDWEVPGLAIAVVSKGEVVLAKGYGRIALDGLAEVDADTLFSIGSTTKAMTAATIGQFVEEGKLGWDDPVIKHLPGFRLGDPLITREVTVRDLLTHRAGLAGVDALWYGSNRSRADMLARLPHVPKAYSLRDGFRYHNLMYVLAGELAGRLAGTSWEDLVATRIFGPLGMTRTVATTTAAELARNVARPHARVEGVVVPIQNEILDTVAPAGAVWSSAADMALWMRMLLAEGRGGEDRILAEATVAELLAPQTLIRGGGLYPYVPALIGPHWISYGLGWFQLDYQGRAVSFHTGSIDGMSAIVGLVPDEDLGVVVLANLDHAELRHALLWKTLDLFGGESEGRDWSADLLPIYARIAAAGEAAREAALAARETGTAPSQPLERLVGTYTNALYGEVEITLADGRLRLMRGVRLAGALEHWHNDVFVLKMDRRWQGEVGVPFDFEGEGGAPRLMLQGTRFDWQPSAAHPRSLMGSRLGPLTGPYAVGTTQFQWFDMDRLEGFTAEPEDHRFVPVQVWYPVAPDANGKRAPYVLDPREFEGVPAIQGAVGIGSRSLLDAPLLDQEADFPVLVYHHGGSWTRFSGSFATEELASHGYVVFGVGHVGFNKTTRRPDGSTLALDALSSPPQTGDLFSDAKASWQHLDDVHFPAWIADARFVLDRIWELDRSDARFADRLDLGRLGMFGWSFGGALSIQMLQDDARVRAAVDQDGQLFGDVAAHGVARPFLLMHSKSAGPAAPAGDVMARLTALTRENDAALRAASTSEHFEMFVEGTQHGHYSDLMVFYPTGPGEIAAARGHEIINAYTRAFFDRYLRNLPGALLDDEPPYAEVRIESGR